MSNFIKSVLAASITPLDSDGNVDAMMLEAYIKYVTNAGGCDGVVLFGTSGEGYSTATSDRLGIPEFLSNAGVKPSKVILGTGCCAFEDVSFLTHAAIAHGYYHVLVMPPYFYKNVTDDGLYSFYSRYIDTVNDDKLRVYLYNFPQLSQIPLSVKLVKDLRSKYGPIIAGIKDSSGDMNNTKSYIDAIGGVNKKFLVFPSSETLYFEGLDMGCAGVISGSVNAFGKLIRKAISATKKDRKEIMKLVNQAREISMKYPIIPAMKQIEAWRTKEDQWLNINPPLERLTKKQVKELRGDLEKLDLFP